MIKTRAEANKIIRILIVDDHPLVRQGISKIIEKESDLQICAEASSANEAITLINKMLPDFIIVDISLDEDHSGIDLVKAVRERFPKIRALVLSMHDESLFAERAIRAGARGYLTKKEAPVKIIEAIHTILSGDIFINQKISGQIIEKIMQSTNNDRPSVADLSDREFEVLHLIGNGLGTGEVAEKLSISTNTVESHRRNIKEKLGLKSGNELVKYAVQWVISQKK